MIGARTAIIGVLASLLVAGAVKQAGAADAFRQLKGREITAKFAGQEFTDEVHFAEVFGRDGSLSAISMGKRKAGKWRVVGDELCRSHERDEPRCHQVWISGTKVQLRQPGIDITEDGVLQKPAARN
ncbi:hypothetical protein [Methylobacterium sp. MA0201]|uniref:hypothetical protein n=1 Tax=Methylobacterium alsaeris TaxID=3344826 RepID=UPI0037574951